MDKTPIRLIGIAGFAGSGKDTLADELLKYLGNTGFKKYSFADPIKQHVNSIFGWGDEHAYGSLKEEVCPRWGFTPRKAYQLYGTEFGRALDPDLWVKLLPKTHKLILPDLRFENEAAFVRNNGGLVIHLKRDNRKTVNGAKNHASELGVKIDYLTDMVVNNNYDLKALEAFAKYLAKAVLLNN